MKKLLVVLVIVIFFADLSFALGEVVVKTGLDIGWISTIDDRESSNHDSNIGASVATELLFPINKRYKVGFGAQYVFAGDFLKMEDALYAKGGKKYEDIPEDLHTVKIGFPRFSMLPVYAIFGMYDEEIGFLNFKAGYTILYTKDDVGYDSSIKLNSTTDNGLYLGIALGDEFASHFIWEIGFDVYFAGSKYYIETNQLSWTYELAYYYKLGISVGYKFNF